MKLTLQEKYIHLIRIIEVLSPQIEIINHQLRERSRILEQLAQWKQTASASEKFRQQIETELQLFKTNRYKQDIPLSEVAYELGLLRYKHSGNPLSLVMNTNKCNLDDAIIWLRDRFGETGMLNAVSNHALNIARRTPFSTFIPPEACSKNFNEVEYYLNQKHSIPRKLLKTLQQRGLLYASTNCNAVFIARNLDGGTTGAYLYSLKNSEDKFTIYSDSYRSRGWFHLSVGGDNSELIETAVINSSPTDALKIMVRNAPHKHRTLYLTIDDENASLPSEYLKNISNIVVEMSERRFKSIRKILSNATKFSTTKQQIIDY